MIRSLTLDHFRCFEHFELHDLGRVNLIVGTNNAGKTSLLEAINLLVARGDLSSIWSGLFRRGEMVLDRVDNSVNRYLDIRRLFHGHELGIGTDFSLTAKTDHIDISMKSEIIEPISGVESPNSIKDESKFDYDSSVLPPLGLKMTWSGLPMSEIYADINRGGKLSIDVLIRKPKRQSDDSIRQIVRFVASASMMPNVVVELFESIVLTPEENLVIRALNFIEPSIQRLASVTNGNSRYAVENNSARGGFLVLCEGLAKPIPIGSMGDGIWRLLGLALSLVRAENGILLIDEIDTGLHYSIMEKMWKLVTETARRLNVQVFATTHSRDCYEGLAVVCGENVSKPSDVTIQRIERGKARSVAYTEQEIVAAAEHGIEVR